MDILVHMYFKKDTVFASERYGIYHGLLNPIQFGRSYHCIHHLFIIFGNKDMARTLP